MIRVAVVGARGRMGEHVCRAVAEAADMKLSAALEHAGHAELGAEVAPGVTLGDDPAVALAQSDVAIDFSTPASTLALVRAAAACPRPLVLATTGFAPAEREEIEKAARELAIVMAANFSLGITALLGLVETAARQLPGYEIEVLEIHHSKKVDAPSGTALALGEAAAAARGRSLEALAVYHREGHTGPRPPDAIGMQTLRAGDTVGEHTVFLVGAGERLELSHRALSRQNFAAGALEAARWLQNRAPGLYSMRDVIAPAK